MSYPAISWALSVAAPLTPTERLLLVVLADHYNPSKGCFPSQRTLLARVGIKSRKQLGAILAKLKRYGLIQVTTRKGRNVYALNMDETMPYIQGMGTPYIQGMDGGNIKNHALYIGHHITSKYGAKRTSKVLPVADATRTDRKSEPKPSGKNPEPESIPETNPEPESNPEPGTQRTPTENVAEEFFAVVPQSPPVTPVSLYLVGGSDMATVKDVLTSKTKPLKPAEIQKAAFGKARGDEQIPPKALWGAWRDFCALYHPEVFVGVPTAAQLAQLRKAGELAGAEIVVAMECCIQHWPDFVKAVKDHGHYLKGTVAYPHVGFFLKHLTIAVNFHRQELTLVAKSPVALVPSPPAAPALTNQTSTPQTSPKAATYEAALRIFGGS